MTDDYTELSHQKILYMTELNQNHISEIPVETNEQDQEIETTEAETKPSSNRERWILFIIAGIIILLDQASKNLVESSLPLYTYYAPIPELENIFRITHISNTGVAFGLFQNGNTIFAIFAVIVTIAIIIYNSKLEPGHKLLRLALRLAGRWCNRQPDRSHTPGICDRLHGFWPMASLEYRRPGDCQRHDTAGIDHVPRRARRKEAGCRKIGWCRSG